MDKLRDWNTFYWWETPAYIHDFVLLPDGRESFEVMNFCEVKVTSSAGKPYDFATNASLITRWLVNFYTQLRVLRWSYLTGYLNSFSTEFCFLFSISLHL